ncbi:MAG: hypothetical protein QG670_1913 [Thermoproteota archaeon]|nr:hypothetical protein [Thermoproteota archaeon]
MKLLTIFGESYSLVEYRSSKDHVDFKNREVVVEHYKRSSEAVLRDFLDQLLYDKFSDIARDFKSGGKIDLFGNLDFEITEKIDKKKQRIAKLKGNKILVTRKAVSLPENILKYIVAHEIAHIVSKRHTERFWKTVGLIFPDYLQAQELLANHSKSIAD